MLGNYLKKYRLKNNLTQSQMAKKIGTSQSYYSMLETGAKKPGFSMINRLAKTLKLEPAFVRTLL